MAKSVAVWGIDIGRCALKALRCHLDGEAVVADGFDYIEYPKLLTQPEADAPQLIKEALEQFLSRNSVKGDRVAISVSGESGLARYFKPPPVDVKTIADIVKYEARQQIPFALEDVLCDYHRVAGGQEVDGFPLDDALGLFAMVTEVQRSIGFFQSLDRKAKISHVVMLGNTVKLPGLVQYLGKHLGYDVQEIESFNKLTGATVVTAPSFKDNVLAFSTCYGLCLQ